jgi:hypothetical protein
MLNKDEEEEKMFAISLRIKLSFTHFFYMLEYKNILIEYTSKEEREREYASF